jgi:hypothetical protein
MYYGVGYYVVEYGKLNLNWNGDNLTILKHEK